MIQALEADDSSPVAVRMKLIFLAAVICCLQVPIDGQTLYDDWHLSMCAILFFLQQDLQQVQMPLGWKLPGSKTEHSMPAPFKAWPAIMGEKLCVESSPSDPSGARHQDKDLGATESPLSQAPQEALPGGS
jgi:hypothetical protein